MTDPRIVKQAKVLVDYSLKVKKGDRVLILSDILGYPLVKEIYRLLVRRGAKEIRLHFDSYELEEIFYREASKETLRTFPKISMDEMKQIDCWIGVRCEANTRGLSGVDSSRMAERLKVVRPIINWRVAKTRWVITNFPVDSQAQEADMSLAEYEDFVFSAINNVDWGRLKSKQEKLRRIVNKVKRVRILSKNTDLEFSISGRKALNGDGENNMPDGEVFTSVVENSTEGIITFTYPAIYMGREFHEVSLTFKKGRVVKASALKKESDLNKILDMDKGARAVGEFGIGNNFRITKFTKDILFDEKIGGSIHLALGNGYTESLSKNISALHWDMICDLRAPASAKATSRQGGELWFDDKLVQKNGKWLLKL
ncbi:hypothetical protein A2V56_03335 [Candidatus Woesebacteria bacterium RBG_19FT_COMBO_42_9]|uniref:Peptidase M29 n=1 Tax=Candidatus Woesebacteria bacterium RBG_16_42_24 TaxID=1802485 RepID=A0A1F7XJZ0_9BACT|nr:MAG: hypothetical protein A2V97_01770 [Candidatus Woesebacteria bacterium RBG_16_42_24]OGM16408.1 MAG: hypothetical protein A2V56_03335 [Candidatus Woesebacteria bacterium RBG_19FT_COMBO_42_9]OGM67339.1 MAG: hypothetical protein A2985_04255 [Candidatus Woesebacteria bacterium RIFCSPLOWO2_01_FULL_43_11]